MTIGPYACPDGVATLVLTLSYKVSVTVKIWYTQANYAWMVMLYTGAGTYSIDPAKAVPLFEVVRLAM